MNGRGEHLLLEQQHKIASLCIIPGTRHEADVAAVRLLLALGQMHFLVIPLSWDGFVGRVNTRDVHAQHYHLLCVTTSLAVEGRWPPSASSVLLLELLWDLLFGTGSPPSLLHERGRRTATLFTPPNVTSLAAIFSTRTRHRSLFA